MTIFNDLNAARAYARACEDEHREWHDDGALFEHEVMSIALLDNGQYAVAHVHWLYELRESVVEFVPKEVPA